MNQRPIGENLPIGGLIGQYLPKLTANALILGHYRLSYICYAFNTPISTLTLRIQPMKTKQIPKLTAREQVINLGLMI